MKKLKQYSDQFYKCWSGRHCETFYTYLDDEINHFNWVYHHTKRTKEGDKKVQEIWIGLHKFRCLEVSHCEKAYYIYYCETFCTMMEGMYSSDGAMWASYHTNHLIFESVIQSLKNLNYREIAPPKGLRSNIDD